MPGTLAFDFFACDFCRFMLRPKRKILFQGGFDPLVNVRGVGSNQRNVFPQLGKRNRGSAGEFAQRLTPVFQIVGGFNGLRFRQLKPGPGVVDVRDGCQPHVETALGNLELACNRLFFRLRQFEIVLRRQHVEVGFGHACHQVLFGRGIVGLGAPHLGLGLAQAGENGVVVDRLREAQRVAGAVEYRAPGRA